MENEVHIGKEVDILSNKIKRRLNNKLSKYGLTGIQFKIISFIYFESKKRDVLQKDIEEEFYIRKSSVTSVIQLLEKNGHIKRISVCNDARCKKLILTEKGLQISLECYKDIMELEDYLAKLLSKDEIKIFTEILLKLNKKLDWKY